MNEIFRLILDSLIVVLLAATIFYAASLHQRLKQLRNSRKDMELAVRSFTEAAIRADAGIRGLKATAEESGAALQKQLDRAQSLRDELVFLVDAGEAVAARLEGVARGAPQVAVPDRDEDLPTGGVPRRPAAGAVRRSRGPDPAAEPGGPDRDLIKAIENMR